MSTHSDTLLSEQRQAIRVQLWAQRKVIERQLEPEIHSSYPRSMTMRFLMQRSVPTAKAIGGVSALLLGLRFFTTTIASLRAGKRVE